MDVLKAIAGKIGDGLVWLYQHEPVITGAFLQAAIVALTGWALVATGKIGLPEDLAKSGVALLGLVLTAGVEVLKRRAVASPATQQKLLETPPPTTGASLPPSAPY